MLLNELAPGERRREIRRGAGERNHCVKSSFTNARSRAAGWRRRALRKAVATGQASVPA
jgi:hypothetical protein